MAETLMKDPNIKDFTGGSVLWNLWLSGFFWLGFTKNITWMIVLSQIYMWFFAVVAVVVLAFLFMVVEKGAHLPIDKLNRRVNPYVTNVVATLMVALIWFITGSWLWTGMMFFIQAVLNTNMQYVTYRADKAYTERMKNPFSLFNSILKSIKRDYEDLKDEREADAYAMKHDKPMKDNNGDDVYYTYHLPKKEKWCWDVDDDDPANDKPKDK